MKEETISWYSFPKELPEELKGTVTKVIIDRGKKGEYAIFDNATPGKFKFFLECKGILGGTLVENINEIMYIALQPEGPKKDPEKTP